MELRAWLLVFLAIPAMLDWHERRLEFSDPIICSQTKAKGKETR
jgi:hypothetical protein